MLTMEKARNALRDAGVRLTPQRLMVVEALIGNRTHPTVDQIHGLVQKQFPTVSLATVYQTVSLLARNGLVRELHGSRDGLRCDPDTSAHAHAFCRKCGTVYDMTLTTPPAWQAATPPGFEVGQVEVCLYGWCHACASSETADATA